MLAKHVQNRFIEIKALGCTADKNSILWVIASFQIEFEGFRDWNINLFELTKSPNCYDSVL